MAEPIDSRPLVSMIYGPITWSIHFLILYVGNALICTRGWRGDGLWGLELFPTVAAIATVIAVLAILVQLIPAIRTYRNTEHHPSQTARRINFQAQSAILLTVLSLVAVLYTAATVPFVPNCA